MPFGAQEICDYLESPKELPQGFPGGPVVKNPLANAGDTGSIPASGRSPGEDNGNALQYSCLGNAMDRGAWRAIVHGVTKESDTQRASLDQTQTLGTKGNSQSLHFDSWFGQYYATKEGTQNKVTPSSEKTTHSKDLVEQGGPLIQGDWHSYKRWPREDMDRVNAREDRGWSDVHKPRNAG